MDINSFVIGYKKGKASVPAGGGSVENANTVTFMSEDGSTVLYQLQVLDGNTCADVVAQGIIATPTKPSTAQYDYTHSGWSLTSGGAADSNALANVTENRTVYAAFAGAVRYYTITYYDTDGTTVFKTESLAYGALPSYTPEKEGSTFQYWEPELEAVTGDAAYYAQFTDKPTLAGSTWAEISEISEAGLGESYFAVGDTKDIAFNGTVGTVAVDETYSVYIIGFDHNEELEGKGIHFGTFKTASGKDIALIDSYYQQTSSSSNSRYNMNHKGTGTQGGWAGCDLRYNILGSTDKAPYGYNSAPTADRVGYDPSDTCATSPVSSSFMNALPSDLRAVMKPMTKYTNNTGGGADTAEMVSVSIDYLPLLAEFEVYGARTYANSYEQNKQKQYDYYAAGNSKLKYKHSATNSTAFMWLRSADSSVSYQFCSALWDAASNVHDNRMSLGIAPIFKV